MNEKKHTRTVEKPEESASKEKIDKKASRYSRYFRCGEMERVGRLVKRGNKTSIEEAERIISSKGLISFIAPNGIYMMDKADYSGKAELCYRQGFFVQGPARSDYQLEQITVEQNDKEAIEKKQIKKPRKEKEEIPKPVANPNQNEFLGWVGVGLPLFEKYV